MPLIVEDDGAVKKKDAYTTVVVKWEGRGGGGEGYLQGRGEFVWLRENFSSCVSLCTEGCRETSRVFFGDG